MSDAPPDAAACRVLINEVQPRLLESLVKLLMTSRVDVELVTSDDHGRTDDVDLVITGYESPESEVPRLLVAVNGTETRLELPYGELSRSVLNFAVAAALRRQPARRWYEQLLEA